MAGLNVVLILRSGGDFKFGDVDLLASRISQWYGGKGPDVICYTDIINTETRLRGVRLIPHPNPEWTGWWSKMILFSPQLEELRPFLYMDLDTAVVGRMDVILPPPRQEKFVMLRDFHCYTRPASGLMWIPANSEKVQLIWKVWSGNPLGIMKQFRGDQDYIRSITTPDELWQDACPNKVFSFKPKRGEWLLELPESAEIICFHGQPRPRAATNVSWVERYIREGLTPPTLPPVAFVDTGKRYDAKATGPRPWFSLLCPSRGRPEMCHRFVSSAYQNAKWPGRLEVLIYLDSDDPSLKDYVSALSSTPARIIVGKSEGVGKAWNCLARASSGEYLMMANDDLVYESKEWDWGLLKQLLRFPDQFVLGYADDGINEGRHCAFPIVSRRWYEELGEFVVEKYLFFRHDTDLWEVGKQIGDPSRVVYIGDVKILHYHHSTKLSPADETTRRNRNNDQNKRDEATYLCADSVRERRAKGSRLRRAVRESRHYNSEVFTSLVHNKKVALVGPSPHLVGAGIGGLLDEYDIVCRVNEVLPIGLEQDYGSKTDILFYGCNKNNVGNFEKTMTLLHEERPEDLGNVKFFMASQRRYDSVNIFAMEQFLSILHSKAPHITNGIVSMSYWTFWQRWIGTHPNTGILALLMLANEAPRELFLTGFSFYSQGLKPNQRHHSSYIEYGGDAAYNKTTMSKIHVQEVQSKWFKEHFMPIYSSVMVVDSYLNSFLGLEHGRVVDLQTRA